MEEIDLKELFRVILKEKLTIILLVMMFMLVGYIYTAFMVVPQYKSSTTVILTQAADKNENLTAITTNDITLNSKLISTYSELIKSNAVIRKVISNLQLEDSEEAVKKNVYVTAVSNTEIIKITITNENAQKAAKIANEIVEVFAEEVKRHFGIENVTTVDMAEPKTEPYNINITKNIIIFGAIGGIIGILYAGLQFLLDNTVKTREDLEKCVNIPVIAQIPLYESSYKRIDRTRKKTRGGRRK